MALNRFSLALIISLVPALALAATAPLQDASQLLQQGKSSQALEKVNGYLAKNAKDPQGRFLKGLILAEMNHVPEAIRIFTDLTNDYPELPEPYNNLAVLYASEGQYEQAKNSLEKAIRTNPTYATAHENLGDIYAKLASQAYDKALQLDKSNTSAQMKLALVRDIFTPTAAERARAIKHGAIKPAALTQDNEPAETPSTTAATDKTKPTPVQPQNMGSSISPVGKTIQDWAAAWSARDVASYLSFYSANFSTPKGMSRADWEAQRKQRLTSPSSIRVDVYDLTVARKGTQATVDFKERYQSNLLKTTVSKQLTLQQEAGAWKIVSEK